VFSDEPDRHPIYHLAEQVLENRLTLAEALDQVATESVLTQVNDTVIQELNRRAYSQGRQDPPRATVLAELNCRAAELKGSDATRGNCQSTLGWLYLKQSKLDLALDCYQEALRLLGPIPRGQAAVARVRLEVGEVKMRQGDLTAAIAEYRAALALARRLKRPYLESDAQNNLGTVYLAQGQVDAALACFQEALGISRKNQDRHGEAAALGNIGRAYRFLGRLNEAIDLHRKALALSEEIDHRAGTGRHRGQLGSALMEKGSLDEAERCFQEALKIACQLCDRPSEQQRLGSLGNLYQARARREADRLQCNRWLAKAQQYHQDALAIARELDDRRSQAHHLLSLGNVHSKLGHFEEAQERYTEARSLAEEQDAVDTQWRVHYAWGNLCTAQRQESQAYRHYAGAIDIVERQRDWLDIESRMRFWQERATLYKRMVLCCLSTEDPAKLWSALAYTERAKARYLADLLAERSSGRSETQKPRQTNTELVEDTLKAIDAAMQSLPESAAVVIFNVTEAGTVVFVVTNQPGGSRAGSLDDGWQRSSDGRIRARLFEGFGQDVLQRILVEVDDSGKAIGGYLVDYYAAPPKWRQFTLESVGAKIYEALLAPVHQELARLRVKRVVFMPNLGLSLLPLHACYRVNGTEREYLLDHYEITYMPSFDVLRHCRGEARPQSPDDGTLLAVANPTGDLVWASFEVECVARFFQQARILSNAGKDRATTESVIAEASNYAFVHFACHGEFDLREPLRSALRLVPPDSLTLETALKQLSLPRTRLVVMSACETGLVDPGDLADEYVGLPAGFLLAGAPGVLSTLWAVKDLSTALLMRRFYLYHLRGVPDSPRDGPLPPAQALRRAQRWLRDEVTARMAAEFCLQRARQALRARDDRACRLAQDAFMRYDRMAPDSRPFAHPVYWAPFIVSGA
jgi:CHAT domain-containing protein/tetratricopeptide (TPR) repeat protein